MIAKAVSGSDSGDEIVDVVLLDYNSKRRTMSTKIKGESSIKYSYDENTGLITEIVSSLGQHVSYMYNSKNQLISVVDEGKKKEILSIRYDQTSNLVEILSTQENKLFSVEIDPKISRVKKLSTKSISAENSTVTYEYEYDEKLFNTLISKKTDKSRRSLL